MNAPNIRRRGIMLVLSSPSGAGKTTLSRLLLERDAGMTMSVSCTTRPKRPGETPGVDYHFVDEATFKDMIAHLRAQDFRKGPGHGAPWEVFGPGGRACQNPVYMASVALPYGILNKITR